MLYVTIHETDNTNVGSNAIGHGHWLQSPGVNVSWHYTVDDIQTVQHLPENEDGFHAGDGAGNGNRHSIGIEICVNQDGDFPTAVARAIALTADICTRRNISISNVVQHFHWSGKNCPMNIRAGRPFGWETYLHKVAEATAGDITWSNWMVLAVIDRAATNGTFTPNVSRVPGTYTQFGIWTIDTLGSFSGESLSNIIKNIPLDRPPLAPTIDSPRNNSITYNTRAMVFIETKPEPDGQPQTLYVRVGSGAWHNSVDNPDKFTTSGDFVNGGRTVYFSDELASGNHTVAVHTSDGDFDSPTVTRTFTVLTSPFDTITFNQTSVKARHITDLRTAVNNIRNYYNMAAYSWGDAIIPGETLVIYWGFHMLEIRAAMEAVIDWVNAYDANASAIIPLVWQNLGTRRPRAAVMNQLRDLSLQL